MKIGLTREAVRLAKKVDEVTRQELQRMIDEAPEKLVDLVITFRRKTNAAVRKAEAVVRELEEIQSVEDRLGNVGSIIVSAKSLLKILNGGDDDDDR